MKLVAPFVTMEAPSLQMAVAPIDAPGPERNVSMVVIVNVSVILRKQHQAMPIRKQDVFLRHVRMGILFLLMDVVMKRAHTKMLNVSMVAYAYVRMDLLKLSKEM